MADPTRLNQGRRKPVQTSCLLWRPIAKRMPSHRLIQLAWTGSSPPAGKRNIPSYMISLRPDVRKRLQASLVPNAWLVCMRPSIREIQSRPCSVDLGCWMAPVAMPTFPLDGMGKNKRMVDATFCICKPRVVQRVSHFIIT